MKSIFLIFLILTAKIGLCINQKNIQVRTSIIIEKNAIDAKELGLIIEDTDYGFHFEFEDKYKSQGVFVNPNIFVYTENININKAYNIILNLRTVDSVTYFSKKIFLENNLSAVNITCFISKEESNSCVIKKVKVEKFINDNNIEIKILDNPLLMSSPRFSLINNTSDTLYPANCLNTVLNGEICPADFFGILFKKLEYGYTQYSPSDFCKRVEDSNQVFLLPKNNIQSYTSNKDDCSVFKIKEKGYYLFSINVSPTPIIRNNYNLPIKSIFEIKTIYVITYKFEVK